MSSVFDPVKNRRKVTAARSVMSTQRKGFGGVPKDAGKSTEGAGVTPGAGQPEPVGQLASALRSYETKFEAVLATNPAPEYPFCAAYQQGDRVEYELQSMG
jgi:hypothetical protein